MTILRLPVFIAIGAPCPLCHRVFRNEQGLGGHIAHLREPGHRRLKAILRRLQA